MAYKVAPPPTFKAISELLILTPDTLLDGEAPTVTTQVDSKRPSTDIAVTVQVPGFLALTMPSFDTQATLRSEENQMTSLLVASEGFRIAVRVSSVPEVIDKVVLSSSMEVTLTVASRTHSSCSLVKPPSSDTIETLVFPGDKPLITPFWSTLAIDGSATFQVTFLLVASSGA